MSGESHRLREVQVDTWGGFVFINFDPNAEPLSEFLGVLPEHFKDFNIEKPLYRDTRLQAPSGQLEGRWRSLHGGLPR